MRSSALFLTGMVMASIATPAFAARTINLTCMQTAVDTREAGYISAFEVYYNTVKGAQVARKDALHTAWTVTDKVQRNIAIKNADKNYRDTEISARRAFKDLNREVNKAFKTQSKPCES